MGCRWPFNRWDHARGANLVEFALTLPYLLIMVFMAGEIARGWHTYEATRMAASDAAYTATMTGSVWDGIDKGNERFDEANLEGDIRVNPVMSQDGLGTALGYRAEATTTFEPAFGAFKGISLLSTAFDITINEVYKPRVQ